MPTKNNKILSDIEFADRLMHISQVNLDLLRDKYVFKDLGVTKSWFRNNMLGTCVLDASVKYP
jgi:hypothetical protein